MAADQDRTIAYLSGLFSDFYDLDVIYVFLAH